MEELRYLIPVMALSIPLAAVVGGAIIKPIAKALSSQKQQDDPRIGELSKRLQATEERLEHMERALRRVEEAEAFHRQLARPAAAPARPDPDA